MPGKPHNLIGKKFGHLEPIQYIKIGDRKARWLCRCVCGKEIVVRADCLRNGDKKSCGCRKYEGWLRGSKNGYWRGYEGIHGRLWCHIRRDAKRRDLEFTITIEEAWDIFTKQGDRCAISNVPIQFSTHGRDYQGCTASLDRIDNTKGYISGNIHWVHKKVNRLKWTMSVEELTSWCNIISNYQRSKTIHNLLDQNIQEK